MSKRPAKNGMSKCPWNEWSAAKNGHLECLENGCDEENGCPWDEEMFDSSMDEETSDSDSGESW